MRCKICLAEFDPYQATDGNRVVDVYICPDCFINEARKYYQCSGGKANE